MHVMIEKVNVRSFKNEILGEEKSSKVEDIEASIKNEIQKILSNANLNISFERLIKMRGYESKKLRETCGDEQYLILNQLKRRFSEQKSAHRITLLTNQHMLENAGKHLNETPKSILKNSTNQTPSTSARKFTNESCRKFLMESSPSSSSSMDEECIISTVFDVVNSTNNTTLETTQSRMPILETMKSPISVPTPVLNASKPKGVPCPKCETRFREYNSFTAHIQLCLPKFDEFYQCRLCPSNFKLRVYFYKHVRRVHSKEFSDSSFDPRIGISCPNYSTNLLTSKLYKEHLRVCHPNKQEIQCPDCSAKTKNYSGFIDHVRIKHAELFHEKSKQTETIHQESSANNHQLSQHPVDSKNPVVQGIKGFQENPIFENSNNDENNEKITINQCTQNDLTVTQDGWTGSTIRYENIESREKASGNFQSTSTALVVSNFENVENSSNDLEWRNDSESEANSEESWEKDGNWEIFDAEKILDKKIIDGKEKYLVKWAGYTHQYNSWVHREDFADEQFVIDFENRLKVKLEAKTRSSERRKRQSTSKRDIPLWDHITYVKVEPGIRPTRKDSNQQNKTPQTLKKYINVGLIRLSKKVIRFEGYPYEFLIVEENQERIKAICRNCNQFYNSGVSGSMGTVEYMILEGCVTEDPHKPMGIPHLCKIEPETESSNDEMDISLPKENSMSLVKSTTPAKNATPEQVSTSNKRKHWVNRLPWNKFINGKRIKIEPGSPVKSDNCENFPICKDMDTPKLIFGQHLALNLDENTEYSDDEISIVEPLFDEDFELSSNWGDPKLVQEFISSNFAQRPIGINHTHAQNLSFITENDSEQSFIEIVKEGKFTKVIKVFDSIQKVVYPHVDNLAPVLKREDPDKYDLETSNKTIDYVEQEIYKIMATFSKNSEKFLMLADSLFLGLKEDLFENCDVLRVEFPFMPSWLDRPRLRFHFEKLFKEQCIPTLFYAMGFDLISSYEYDEIQDVVNKTTTALTEFMDLMESHSRVARKNIGILSPVIKEFNSKMLKEIVEINEAYENRVHVKVLNYAELINDALNCGLIAQNHTLDDRFGELIRELFKTYQVKLQNNC
uniref:Chromo domain-containing protein n=1 Tax=Acrobeloides nanus TaxID=290746 RepID=A0A914DGP5_9BILA